MLAPLPTLEFNAALQRALSTPQRKAWLKRYQDIVWPLREWPADEARILFGAHAGHDERYKLCKFAAANAIAPLVLVHCACSAAAAVLLGSAYVGRPVSRLRPTARRERGPSTCAGSTPFDAPPSLFQDTGMRRALHVAWPFW